MKARTVYNAEMYQFPVPSYLALERSLLSPEKLSFHVPTSQTPINKRPARSTIHQPLALPQHPISKSQLAADHHFRAKYLPSQQHLLTTGIDCMLVKLLPASKKKTSLLIIAVYSPPSYSFKELPLLLRNVIKITEHQRLAVLGAFNSPPTAWCYTRNAKSGRTL